MSWVPQRRTNTRHKVIHIQRLCPRKRAYKHFLTWWLSDLSCKLLTVCPAIHLNYNNFIMWKIWRATVAFLHYLKNINGDVEQQMYAFCCCWRTDIQFAGEMHQVSSFRTTTKAFYGLPCRVSESHFLAERWYFCWDVQQEGILSIPVRQAHHSHYWRRLNVTVSLKEKR